MIENIPEPSPPPPIAPPSSWGARALGHLWFILTFIPVQIFSLLLKIKNVFLCSFAEAEVSQKNHKITATKEPVPPTTTFPLKKEERLRVVAADSLPDLRYVRTPLPQRKVEDIEPDLDLASLFVENEQPTSNQAQGKEVVQEKQLEIEIAPQPVSKEIVEAPQQMTDVETADKSKELIALNVPDDGNCLFYACGVGIRKKYHDIPTIQEKLAWKVDPLKLTGDLRKQADLLAEPAARLRKQATDFLKENQDEEYTQNALLSGIYDHNPVIEKRIKDLELTIFLFNQDIEQLYTQIENDQFSSTAEKKHIESQVQRQIEQAEATQRNIKIEQQNLLNMEAENLIVDYIEKAKQNNFYCDTPHIYAISRFYDIPITVIMNYGQKNQASKTYNLDAVASVTPITIALVNGNHYMYIDTETN